MKVQLKKRVAKFSPTQVKAAVFIAVFACLGIILIAVHAATPLFSTTATSGTLSGNVASCADASATTGNAIKFGSTSCSSSTTTTPPSSSTKSQLGIYDGEFGPSGIETGATWLGGASSIPYAMDFIDATDWSHIDAPWQLSNWQGSPFTMVWGVPMLPCGAPATQCATNTADFADVANGSADTYYKTLAQNLISSGFGSSYIRLGWEFNGTWMGWSVCNQQGTGLAAWASDFVPAFQNIVTSMRSANGANFKFIWNPIDSSNGGCTGLNLENMYPGDSYVDMVALDTYDGVGAATTDTATFSDIENGVNAGDWTAEAPESINGQSFEGYGLNWLAAFGKEHNKEVGLPEWGLDETTNGVGGGDDAYFVTQVGDWIKANATGPSIFWNYGQYGNLGLDIPSYNTGDDSTPNATAAFKTIFGE
jgi:hypothetical protein